MKYIFRFFLSIIFLLIVVYFTAGFYVAYQILKIDPTCGLHEGSLPNSWSTKVDSHLYSILSQQRIRENFNYKDYYLDEWQDVYFQSRDYNIKLNGWLFNYFPKRPIIIVTHGISPNGKCKSESNIIAGLLIKKKFNVLTIDLRNYGQSDTVSRYDDLGLESYNDILGAFDFLKDWFQLIVLVCMEYLLVQAHLFLQTCRTRTKAIWSDSSLAEFKMILKMKSQDMVLL